MWQCWYLIFLDNMLKMVKTMAKALVKTMGKTMTEIDLMIARFDYMYIDLIIYRFDYIYTFQFSTTLNTL